MAWLDMVSILMGHGGKVQVANTLVMDHFLVGTRIHSANRPV